MCGLVMGTQQTGLVKRKEKLKLTKEATERRQAYVEGVQKAQTKRWLKQEYGVELVDALEDAIDGLCERQAEVVERVCGLPSFATVTDKEVEIAKKSVLKQPLKGTEGYDGYKPEECRGRIKTLCLRVVVAQPEEMEKTALAGGGPDGCMSLWPSCTKERAFLFHNSTEEAAAAKVRHDKAARRLQQTSEEE
eukprot:1131412-Prymnesium_polylepis.1